jgi:hypothetical protein
MAEGSYTMRGTPGASTNRRRKRKTISSNGTGSRNSANGTSASTTKAGGYEGKYEFPHGDFKNVHRCGVLTAESRAGQYKHYDIENAAHLHGMIDGRHGKSSSRRTRAAPHHGATRSPLR